MLEAAAAAAAAGSWPADGVHWLLSCWFGASLAAGYVIKQADVQVCINLVPILQTTPIV